MLINGTNVSTFNAIPSRRAGNRGIVNHDQLVEVAPGASRGVLVGRGGASPHQVTVEGFVYADTVAGLQANLDRLAYECDPERDLQLEFSDRANVEFVGRVVSLEIGDMDHGWVVPVALCRVKVAVAEPYRRDTSSNDLTDSGTAIDVSPLVVTLTVGTAPMPVVITILGGAGTSLVDPVINYRDGANTILQTLTYAGTLTGTDTVIINTETFACTLNGADARANLSGTFFDVNPRDGDFQGSPNAPDIQLTATSGDADDFDVDYRRRWR